MNETMDAPEATWWQEKLMDLKPICQSPCCAISGIVGSIILIIGAVPLFILLIDNK